MEPLDEAVLAEIEARVATCEPENWKSWIEGRDHSSGDSFIQAGEREIYLSGMTLTELDFIVNARQDVPRLIAEVKRLRALLTP